MRRVLVTGGAGFIGSHIAYALVQRGDKVRVLDNLCTGFKANLSSVAQDVEFHRRRCGGRKHCRESHVGY